MRSSVFLIVLVLALAVLAVGVYYVIYARNINKKIREGNLSGKKMLDIPHTMLTVLIVILVFYAVMISVDYKQYRNSVNNLTQNRNNIARVDLSDYTYCGYTGSIALKDASFLKAYSKEDNEGYKKTVSKEGNFTFTVFTRTSVHDDFHPDFLCYVEYTGQNRDGYGLYENYEYLDSEGNVAGGFGSMGGDISKEYLYVGNVNDGQSVRITQGILGMDAKQSLAQAEEEAIKNNQSLNYLDYTEEWESVTVVVDFKS